MPVTHYIIIQKTHPCLSEDLGCLLDIRNMELHAELHITDIYMQDKAHTIQMSPKARAMWYISPILCRVGLSELLFLLWPAAFFRNVLPLTLSLLSSLLWDAHTWTALWRYPDTSRCCYFTNFLISWMFLFSNTQFTPPLHYLLQEATYKFKV